MKAPIVLEDYSDVTVLSSTDGDLKKAKCGGLFTFFGTFARGTVEISFNMGQNWWPLSDGRAFPMQQGQTYKLRLQGGTGTLRVAVWEGDPTDSAAMATIAAAGSSSDDAALLAVMEDIQDQQGAAGTDRVFALGTGSANTALVVDIATQGAGTRIVVDSIHVSFEGSIIGASTEINLNDDGAGGTSVWLDIMGVGESEGTPHQNPPGFQRVMDAAAIARLEVEAGGAGVIVHASLSGFVIPA